MDSSTAKEILHVIRSKRTIPLSERPPKVIFGSDMESPNSTDSLWNELMKRQRIKKRIAASKQRRIDKIKRLEAIIQQGEENGHSDFSRDQLNKAVASLKSDLRESSPNSDLPNDNAATHEDAKPSTSSSQMSLSSSDSKKVTFVSVVQVHQPDSESETRISPLEDAKTEVKSRVNSGTKPLSYSSENTDTDKIEMERKGTDGNENKTENESQEKISNTPSEEKPKSRWKKHKILPLSSACFKLKKRIDEEKESQMELLETIRVLRGISKDEFYKDITRNSVDDSSDDNEEENENEDEIEPLEEVKEENNDNEVKLQDEDEIKEQTDEKLGNGQHAENEEDSAEEDDDVFQDNEISGIGNEGDDEQSDIKTPPENFASPSIHEHLIRRVDSRWPKGHRLHTKPAEIKYFSAYLQPERKKQPKPVLQQLNDSNVSHFQSDLNDYETWREQLLQIAYLKEFDHLKGKSLKSFSVPLPDIKYHEKATKVKIAEKTSKLENKSNSKRSSKNTNTSQVKWHVKNTSPRQSKFKNVYQNSHPMQLNKTFEKKENSINRLHKIKKQSKPTNEIPLGLQKPNDVVNKSKEDAKFRKKYRKLPAELNRKANERPDSENIEIRDTNPSTDSAINEPSFHSDLESDAEIYSQLPATHNITMDDYGNEIITFHVHAHSLSQSHVTLPGTRRHSKSQSSINSHGTGSNNQSQKDRKIRKSHVITAKRIDLRIMEDLKRHSKPIAVIENPHAT